MEQQTGIVIYTDGSARPNPGFIGAGLHGYVYTTGVEKYSKAGKWLITDQGYLPAGTEKDQRRTLSGELLPLPQPVTVSHYLDIHQPSLEIGTNNISEVTAPCLLFEYFPDLVEAAQRVFVISDSKLMIQGITEWIHGWLRNNWVKSAGGTVNNREYWERLHRHVSGFQERGEITFQWIKGHNDDFGNVKADWLAGIATNNSTARRSDAYVMKSPAPGYHKSDVDLHPFINLKRLYFNTSTDYHTPGVYYQAGYSGQEFVYGKRVGDSSFSVLMLNTPEKVVEDIIIYQCERPTDVNSIMYIKLDRLRSPDIYSHLVTHGRYCLVPEARNLNLNFVDQKPMTFEVKSGELPLRAVDILNQMEEFLTKFKTEHLAGQPFTPGLQHMQLHDITDHFYEAGVKKVGKTEVPIQTLRKEFVVGIARTDLTFTLPTTQGDRTFTRPLLFSEDLPNRNALKRIEPLHPKLYLITWQESNAVLRYCVIVQTDDALSIWSSHFSNLIYFN